MQNVVYIKGPVDLPFATREPSKLFGPSPQHRSSQRAKPVHQLLAGIVDTKFGPTVESFGVLAGLDMAFSINESSDICSLNQREFSNGRALERCHAALESFPVDNLPHEIACDGVPSHKGLDVISATEVSSDPIGDFGGDNFALPHATIIPLVACLLNALTRSDKRGNPDHWPENLRVRQFPGGETEELAVGQIEMEL